MAICYTSCRIHRWNVKVIDPQGPPPQAGRSARGAGDGIWREQYAGALLVGPALRAGLSGSDP